MARPRRTTRSARPAGRRTTSGPPSTRAAATCATPASRTPPTTTGSPPAPTTPAPSTTRPGGPLMACTTGHTATSSPPGRCVDCGQPVLAAGAARRRRHLRPATAGLAPPFADPDTGRHLRHRARPPPRPRHRRLRRLRRRRMEALDGLWFITPPDPPTSTDRPAGRVALASTPATRPRHHTPTPHARQETPAVPFDPYTAPERSAAASPRPPPSAPPSPTPPVTATRPSTRSPASCGFLWRHRIATAITVALAVAWLAGGWAGLAALTLTPARRAGRGVAVLAGRLGAGREPGPARVAQGHDLHAAVAPGHRALPARHPARRPRAAALDPQDALHQVGRPAARRARPRRPHPGDGGHGAELRRGLRRPGRPRVAAVSSRPASCGSPCAAPTPSSRSSPPSTPSRSTSSTWPPCRSG